MKKTILLPQAIAGYELYFQARHLSTHTYQDYFNTYRKFTDYLATDPPIDQITQHDIEGFLAEQDELSNKTLLNYHTGLSALWSWCVQEDLVTTHILQKVERPKPEKRVIKPYSEADVCLMLNSLDRSRTYVRPNNPEVSHALPQAERNRAMIFLLLDTGLRATELCELHINQVDLRNRHVIVMGKGSKERSIPFCARTAQALWKYLAARKDETVNGYLFLSGEGGPLDPDLMSKLMYSIGCRPPRRHRPV
jgi:site-specific recombinase XerD